MMTIVISEALQQLIDAKVAVPMTCTRYDCECAPEDHVAGSRAYMGDMRSPSYGDAVDMYRLDCVVEGSDYSGCSVTESNYRSLLRDHPDVFIDVYGGWSSYGLALPVTFGQGDEDTQDSTKDLADTLVKLAHDYPLYDEEDNSILVDERAVEAWDSWVRPDLERTLETTFKVDDVDLCDHKDDFWQLCQDHEIYPEAEGHRDVTFRGIDDAGFLADLFKIAEKAGNVTVSY